MPKRQTLLEEDRQRSPLIPYFQVLFRKQQECHCVWLKKIYAFLYILISHRQGVEIPPTTQIGGGLYIGHPYCITINKDVIIGRNCNIHKGVTIGQENRGKREGYPTIGNHVWIGVNATIVGKIIIGNDVLIAPNSFVNCSIPNHSIVIGNPCTIIHREGATNDYINHAVED